jgi:hypothetical protein
MEHPIRCAHRHPFFGPATLTCLSRRQLLALALLLVLLQACPQAIDCSPAAAVDAGEVAFAANSAASDGEFQAPALHPEGLEVKKFEQMQRCLVCRFVQETATATGNADDSSAPSKVFGTLLLRTCPSLPSFLRAPCSDAAAAVSGLAANAATSDICHAAKVCSVPLIDPFESAKLLATSCQPSRCTIHHHVSRRSPLRRNISPVVRRCAIA